MQPNGTDRFSKSIIRVVNGVVQSDRRKKKGLDEYMKTLNPNILEVHYLAVEFFRDNPNILSPRELHFCKNMLVYLRNGVEPTQKQLDYLLFLYDREQEFLSPTPTGAKSKIIKPVSSDETMRVEKGDVLL